MPKRSSDSAQAKKVRAANSRHALRPLGARPTFTPRRAAQLAAQDERLLRSVISKYGVEGLIGGAPTSTGGGKGMIDGAYYDAHIADDRTLAAMSREYSHTKRVRSLRAQVMREVSKGVIKAVLETAECMAINAQSNIMNNIGGEGQALGPGWKEVYLADSIYIATSKKSGYEAAKAASQSAKTSKRRAWAPEIKPVDDGPHSFAVVVASAYQGAGSMHDGYADGKSGKIMRGTPFLTRAFDKCEAKLKAGGEAAAQMASTVHVPTVKDEHIKDLTARARDSYVEKSALHSEQFEWAGHDSGAQDGSGRRRWYAEKVVKGRTVKYIAVEDVTEWFQRVYDQWAHSVSREGNL